LGVFGAGRAFLVALVFAGATWRARQVKLAFLGAFDGSPPAVAGMALVVSLIEVMFSPWAVFTAVMTCITSLRRQSQVKSRNPPWRIFLYGSLGFIGKPSSCGGNVGNA